MNTDDISITYDKTCLKKLRPLYLLAFVFLVLSLILQQPLIFLSAFFLLIIALVPDIWYRHALRHLVVSQQASPRHIFFGEEVSFITSIENQKLLPLPWLRLENTIAPPLTVLVENARREKIPQITSTWLLWSFQRVTRQYRLRCYARGLYTFGPAKLRSSDPFGWLECEVPLPIHKTLLVYPLIAPLETLGLPFLHPFGEYITPRRLLEDPLRVAGVRDYQLGDDPRRIHWKATAHTGTLRSKIYEYSSLPRLLLLLDTWNFSPAWMGSDQEIQELSITLAASLALWGLDEGYMVGLLANSAVKLSADELLPTSQIATTPPGQPPTKMSVPGVSVPFARDDGQYERLLSTLARLVPEQHIPIEHVIDLEDSVASPGTTIILISAATTLNEDTIERLLDLRTRGASIHLVLTGDCPSKHTTETHDLPVHTPGGREKWHELLHSIHHEEHEAISTNSASLQLD